MKILIKEEKLKGIINSLIMEKLGVPDNIINTATQVFNELISEIRKMPLSYNFVNPGLIFRLKETFNIANYNFESIETRITFKENSKVTEPVIYKMGFIFASEYSKRGLKYTGDPTNITLLIHIALPDYDNYDVDFNKHDLETLFMLKKPSIISDLTHELQHSYDKSQKTGESFYKRSEYNTFSTFRTGIYPIDRLIHGLYFTSKIEKTTRPAELLAFLKLSDVNKENFLDLLNQNTSYQTLNWAREITYDQIMSEIKSNMDEVDEFLNMIINDYPNEYGYIKLGRLKDDQKIHLALNSVFKAFQKYKVESLKSTVGIHGIFSLFDDDYDEKKKKVDKYSNKVMAEKNYQKYFEKQIKLLNFEAEKQLKKIHKLYALIHE